MTMIALSIDGCGRQPEPKAEENEFQWIVDRFDDIKVLRYRVDGFEQLPLQQKLLVYYLNQAALCGRDIIYDQNFKYNLMIRRALEAIYTDASIDRTTPEWAAFEKYLKKVWFANGIHHHYSSDKFQPEFSQTYFDTLLSVTPHALFPLDVNAAEDMDEAQKSAAVEEAFERMRAIIEPVIFDPTVASIRVNQNEGVDVVVNSANNYYEGVTQREAENFYARMMKPGDKTPISYGLNSKLVKENGKIVERVWRVGGMYSSALEQIVGWLEKAAEVAEGTQQTTIEKLISYYRSGDLKEFDQFNVLWVQDTDSKVDFVNGFTENYGDPLGYKSSWEALVNFRDEEATKRTATISDNAQWFEDNSPIQPQYKKKEVKGVSAKVITAAMLGGDSYPATAIGINLPNADWIRKDYGSKSVTIQNITYAYAESARGNGFQEEFVLRPEDRARIEKYGTLADNLHTDLHECLGHGSGQLAPGTKGDELRQYGSALEETRADLFGLYYLADDKLVELGIVPDKELYKAQYASYIMNGMMTQLARIEFGKNVEQAHMRNRKLIAEWCYDMGRKENVIEKVVENGKTYVVVNDFEKLRSLFGQMLREIQRIKSEGDYQAGRELIENYAVKIDPALHREVLDRYAQLNIAPFSGFVNPRYSPVMEAGKIVDIAIEYVDSYPEQMLEYSQNYSFLPVLN